MSVIGLKSEACHAFLTTDTSAVSPKQHYVEQTCNGVFVARRFLQMEINDAFDYTKIFSKSLGRKICVLAT